MCIHRFNNKVDVENFDSQRFPGWSDLRVFIHFVGHILLNIARGVADPNNCVFVILTKDRNFIEDVKKEYEAKRSETYLPLVFSGNSIKSGGIIVIIQQIDCRVYSTKRNGDLKCAFKKINSFLSGS